MLLVSLFLIALYVVHSVWYVWVSIEYVSVGLLVFPLQLHLQAVASVEVSVIFSKQQPSDYHGQNEPS